LRLRQLAPEFQEAQQIRDRRTYVRIAQTFPNPLDHFFDHRQFVPRIFQSFSLFHVSPRLRMPPDESGAHLFPDRKLPPRKY